MIALSKLPFPVAITTLALAWGSLGFAQAAAPSQARTAAGSVPVATPKPATAELTLKSRSTFSAASETAARNPFLPIGYVRAAGPARVEAVMEVRPEQFTVTSTLLDVPPLAVINGKSYEVGDKIKLDNTGKEFVTVKQIGDGLVLLEYRGQILRCLSRARGGK